jgi:carbon-monoxide dehydrogenase medium subunit
VIYLKLPARTAVDIAAVGVSVLVSLDFERQTCSDVKIVLGAVGPTPFRAKSAEKIMRSEKIDNHMIQKAAQLASEEAHPISDVRSSANYRAEMVQVLARQAISQALEQAKST